MNRLELINLLVSNKILGKNLKASKLAEQKLLQNSIILKELVSQTDYLKHDATLYERLMNIRLGIESLPKCEECESSLSGKIFWSERRYHRFCDASCRHNFVTRRRITKLKDNDSKIAKAASQKSIQTQRARGTLKKRIVQSLETKRKTGQCIPLSQVSAYEKYKSEVYSITRKQPLMLLENFELRGSVELDGWHLDHQYSIKSGFENKVSPLIVGHLCNLKMIPGKLNVKKNSKCSITLDKLISLIKDFEDKNNKNLRVS